MCPRAWSRRSRLSGATCAASGAGPELWSDTRDDREVRMRIVERTFAEADRRSLLEAGVHPVLARIYAGRRIRSADELKYEPAGLLAPQFLKSISEAATLLADAIETGKRMLIVADYDADGATACAVGIR